VLNIKQINAMLKQAIANSLEKKYHGVNIDELPSPEEQIRAIRSNKPTLERFIETIDADNNIF